MRRLKVVGYVECTLHKAFVPISVCSECKYIHANVGDHTIVCSYD